MDRLRQAQRDGVVVGLKDVAGVVPRRDIDDLLLNEPDTFNLFLLALKELQDNPDSSQIMGYYQIAGIHGLPKAFWDNIQDPKKSSANRGQSGYCAHSTLTFPTWHRPYLSMLEQTIYAKIVEIVERFPEAQKPKYRTAAQKFRLPYWDYYRPRGRRNTVFPGVRAGGQTSFNYDFSVPQIFLTEQVMVRTPAKDALTPFDNPLNFFHFPSQGSIPANQWSIVGPDVATFSRVRTTRYPTSRDPLRGDTTKLNAAINKEREPNTGYIMNMILDPPYATYDSFATDTASSGASGSLESIHGLYHVLIGGNGGDGATAGHMSRVAVAAFDPIFWLHHCQIDRYFAIWQAAHPQAWFPTNARTLQTQDLLPFRISKTASGSTFWNSDTSRTTDAFGYTYPDLVGGAQAVRSKFQEHYQWSVRTSTRPFGTPPADMQPLDIGKAQVFQFASAASSNPTLMAATLGSPAPPATTSRSIETAPTSRGIDLATTSRGIDSGTTSRGIDSHTTSRGFDAEPASTSSKEAHPHLHAIKNAFQGILGHSNGDSHAAPKANQTATSDKHAGTPFATVPATGHAPIAAAAPHAAQAPMVMAAAPGDQKHVPAAAPSAPASSSTAPAASPPSVSFTNLQNSDVVVAAAGSVDESKINREWYVDDIVERLALNDSFTIYFFLGDFNKSAPSNYIVEPALAGLSHIFAAPPDACDNCGRQEEQAHLITHTTPITPMLLDYVEIHQLPSLAPQHVEPFLVKNLKWRIVTVNGDVVNPRTVAGLKIGISSKLAPIPPATGAPTYQEFPHVVEQIIANSS